MTREQRELAVQVLRVLAYEFESKEPSALNFKSKAFDAAADALEQQDTRERALENSQWIPVEERLPEVTEDQFGINGSGKSETVRVSLSNGWVTDGEYLRGYREDLHRWTTRAGMDCFPSSSDSLRVLAWKPLEKPYEQVVSALEADNASSQNP